jgi:hypothetical protein
MDDYGIYSLDGKKLSNSFEILNNGDLFWGNVTKKVLDITPNNAFGIVIHPLWMDYKLYWIVRESKKWRLDIAVWWCKKMFRNGYE